MHLGHEKSNPIHKEKNDLNLLHNLKAVTKWSRFFFSKKCGTFIWISVKFVSKRRPGSIGWGRDFYTNSNENLTMTSSNGNIFRVTGHLCGEFSGEFPAQRPVTRSFGVFFDLRLNKRLTPIFWLLGRLTLFFTWTEKKGWVLNSTFRSKLWNMGGGGWGGGGGVGGVGVGGGGGGGWGAIMTKIDYSLLTQWPQGNLN